MPSEGRIVITGGPITFPFPNGVLFTIATDGTYHVLARAGGDPFVFIADSETLTNGASEVTTTTWRADVAAQLGETDGVGGSGVVTAVMRIGVPGTNKFIVLGQNFDTPENLYQVLGIEYTLDAAGDVNYVHKYHYFNDAGNFGPPGFLGGSFGGAVGQALIGDDVYFIADFLGGGGGDMQLVKLPTLSDEVVTVSGSWDDKRYALPGPDFNAVLWWNDVAGGAGLFEHPDGIGILAYLDATLWFTVIGAGGSNTGQNDISADFGIPFEDEGLNFVGSPTAFVDDLYTTPSINVLPDGRLEFFFIREYSDIDGMIGVRWFTANSDLTGIQSLGFFQIDLTDIAGAGAESAYGYRISPTEVVWVIKEDAALDFKTTVLVTPDAACPPCEVDTSPCGETVEPACLAEWPLTLLQPRSVGVFLVPANIGGGPAMAGGHEEVAATANGFWRFTYADIPIHDRDQILKIRELEVLLEGKAGVICLHAYDGKRSPWLTVGDPIIASAASAFAVGATSGSIQMTSGGVPQPGMFFSWEDTTSGSIAGPHLYCLETVGPVSSGDTYAVTFQPPIRTAIAINDPLEFTHPMCRARLADDRGLSVELNLHEHASHTVDFEEDKP